MKTKYTFEKRQKELARLQKKKEKLAKRQAAKESPERHTEQQDEVEDN
ncbi:MAG: hypothetical protein JW902_02525 [Syntrophaceae bacterium]|nr:hypothetical protein [Syntrophaceae bacterium]